MRNGQYQDLLHVRSQATGAELLREETTDWFNQTLLDRTLWLAACQEPWLGGKLVKTSLESECGSDAMVRGWTVRLCTADGQQVFCRRWPLAVLQSTALAVGHQCQEALDNGKIVYWVQRHAANDRETRPDDAILFDDDEEETVAIPSVPTRPDAAGRILSSSAGVPGDAVVLLHAEAWEKLATGIERQMSVELAWIGAADIWRSAGTNEIVYEIADLRALASPGATQALVPIRPDELVDFSGSPRPVILVHTHVVPSDAGGRVSPRQFLDATLDDLRSLHRLSFHSLGMIVGSRPPFCARAWGWPADGEDLTELRVTVMLADKK